MADFSNNTVNQRFRLVYSTLERLNLIKGKSDIASHLGTYNHVVNSILKGTSERPEVKIDWRIYTKKIDNPLIRDLIIEGLSLARTQKEEFSSILQSNDGDINALFKSLEEFTKN